jgi:acyl-CoA synthetase (AMP-forming)/AMP-acid ligase II
MLSLIRAEGVTCMRAVPAMLRMLLASPDFCAATLPSLRLIVNSSAPIDPATYSELKHRFASIQVMNSYGLTEASTCTVLPDAQALSHAGSVGMPIEGVQMRLCDEEGNAVPSGSEGEIWVRGEHVFVGYRNRPEKTRAVLVDGWLHTGDLAHQDEQGLYYLHGRRDDVINCAGRKFAPADVENCILQMSEVQEAAVVGMPHPVLGQVVKAYVVLKPGVAPNAKIITRHCAQNLPSHKVPFYVEFALALPRNSTGKVLRRKLAV